VLFAGGAPRPELAAAAWFAHQLARTRVQEPADPWARLDGWRMSGASTRRVRLTAEGWVVDAALRQERDGSYGLQLRRVGDAPEDMASVPFNAEALGSSRYEIRLGSRRVSVAVYPLRDGLAVFGDGEALQVSTVDPLAAQGDASAHGGGVSAPMPGKVIAFHARVGERVKRGQPLAVMEAMKMEHTLHAPGDGVVRALRFSPGEQVGEGEALIDFEPAS
jgi:3-methylcrotonyl-CoA carboxylase alpha subunit